MGGEGAGFLGSSGARIDLKMAKTCSQAAWLLMNLKKIRATFRRFSTGVNDIGLPFNSGKLWGLCPDTLWGGFWSAPSPATFDLPGLRKAQQVGMNQGFPSPLTSE